MGPQGDRQSQARQGCSQEFKGGAAHIGNYEFDSDLDCDRPRLDTSLGKLLK
jgi:hypothetical protein